MIDRIIDTYKEWWKVAPGAMFALHFALAGFAAIGLVVLFVPNPLLKIGSVILFLFALIAVVQIGVIIDVR